MKKMIRMIAPLCLFAATALAAESPSTEHGKALFDSADLGTNGKSCATCHPGGARLTEAAGYGDAELTTIINSCISKPLKGKKLADDSVEMKSLVMYIHSLKPADKK
jgi:cytochrome c peroxidase